MHIYYTVELAVSTSPRSRFTTRDGTFFKNTCHENPSFASEKKTRKIPDPYIEQPYVNIGSVT